MQTEGKVKGRNYKKNNNQEVSWSNLVLTNQHWKKKTTVNFFSQFSAMMFDPCGLKVPPSNLSPLPAPNNTQLNFTLCGRTNNMFVKLCPCVILGRNSRPFSCLTARAIRLVRPSRTRERPQRRDVQNANTRAARAQEPQDTCSALPHRQMSFFVIRDWGQHKRLVDKTHAAIVTCLCRISSLASSLAAFWHSLNKVASRSEPRGHNIMATGFFGRRTISRRHHLVLLLLTSTMLFRRYYKQTNKEKEAKLRRRSLFLSYLFFF